MATEQLHTKVPPLALTIPSAPTFTQPAVQTVTRSFTSTTVVPARASKTSAPATGATSVSTPTSGMHSPPLSNTVEEEDIEMNSAAAATKNAEAARTVQAFTAKLTTPPPTTSSSAKAPTPTLSITSSHTTTDKSFPHATKSVSGTATATPLALTTSATAPTLFKDLSNTNTHLTSQSSHLDESMVDERKKGDLQVQQRYDRERTIEHVLKQGKILKVSRRLRTRLEYAILKIRRGWSKYTLQEVESLIKPTCSPRFTPGQIQQSLSRQSSPRLAERKRVVKTHPASETTTSDAPSLETDQSQDVEMTYPSHAPAIPTGRFRSRMPSLSQFKDSELYLPAKSLMEIATSKPEPGYLSPRLTAQSLPSHEHHGPYHRQATPEPLYRDATPVRDTHSQGHRSGYSTPAAPSTPVQLSSDTFDDEQVEENPVPSAAQAARTILMLASPTRPPPRTLNQNYIVEMHAGNPTHAPLPEWTTTYSPMTSSPLVHFQTTASSTPSPDKTPTMSVQSAPSFMGDDRNSNVSSNQKNSIFHTSKPMKQPYSSLYGTGHEPSSPSPLSTALFPSLNEPMDRVIKSHSRSSSPTLKRAVRFAAAATNASEFRLPVESIHEKIPGLSTGRTEYNNTADAIYPGSQPSHDDKKELSFDNTGLHGGEGYLSAAAYNNTRTITPPPSSTWSSSGAAMASHGMRTPPPSGGQDLNLSHYAVASKRRRDSDTPPVGMTDLPTMFRQGPTTASSHAARPGPFAHH